MRWRCYTALSMKDLALDDYILRLYCLICSLYNLAKPQLLIFEDI
jgi:hypothetical protein